MKKLLLVGLSFCIGLSLLAFIRTTDLDGVLALVSRVGFNAAWLILITGMAHCFGAMSWRYCLGGHRKRISTFRLFLIRHVGETVALFNPASIVGGDAVKVLLLKNYDIDRRSVITSVVVSRLVLVASQLALFVFTLMVLAMQNAGFSAWPVHSKATGLYLLFHGKVKGLRLKMATIFKEIHPFFRHYQGALGWSALFALLHWFFGAMEFFFILKFLNMEVSIVQALLIDLGVVFFKAAGAFIPGQLGVEEYGNKIMLMAIGIPDTDIWLSASILRRGRQLVWIALGALAWFLLYRRHRLSPEGLHHSPNE